eukprot:a841714_446.p1 GENE.a841714_446~~a841714_446.p1  ORF type:complete len:322 (-),score=82.48 a841714_446:824-1744(-)
MTEPLLTRCDLFTRKERDRRTSTFLSRTLTILLPIFIVLYLVFFFVDIARNPVERTSETIVASDGEDNGSPILFRCLAQGGCALFTEYTPESGASGHCGHGFSSCTPMVFGETLETVLCFSNTISDGIYLAVYEDLPEVNTGAILSGKRAVPQLFGMGDTLANDYKTGKALARAITVDATEIFKPKKRYYSYWMNGAVANTRSFNSTISVMKGACPAAARASDVFALMFFRSVAVTFETHFKSRLLHSFTAIGGFMALLLTIFGAFATGYRIVAMLVASRLRGADAAATAAAGKPDDVALYEYAYE